MKLKFINAQELDRNVKATLHKSGKLGFTVEAAKKLELSAEKSISIAINEDDEKDKNLYVVVNDAHQRDAFKVSKAGGYFYISTKPLFDSMKIDYAKEWIVYDISKDKIDGYDIYKFKRREMKGKDEREEEDAELT